MSPGAPAASCCCSMMLLPQGTPAVSAPAHRTRVYQVKALAGLLLPRLRLHWTHTRCFGCGGHSVCTNSSYFVHRQQRASSCTATAIAMVPGLLLLLATGNCCRTGLCAWSS